jgi:hypothetical protein
MFDGKDASQSASQSFGKFKTRKPAAIHRFDDVVRLGANPGATR